MLARLRRLFLDISLSERVCKYSSVVYVPPYVGYWGTYTIYIVYYGNTVPCKYTIKFLSFCYYTFFQKFHTPLHSEPGTPLTYKDIFQWFLETVAVLGLLLWERFDWKF